jgi:hypothetical protein
MGLTVQLSNLPDAILVAARTADGATMPNASCQTAPFEA